MDPRIPALSISVRPGLYGQTSTPFESGKSPAQLLLGFEPRTRLSAHFPAGAVPAEAEATRERPFSVTMPPFFPRKAHLVPPISTRAEMAARDSNSNGRQTDGESGDPPRDPAPACRPAEGTAHVKHAGKETIGNRHKSSGNSASPRRSRSQSSDH
ncbi:hypothetical protein MRX96_053495 [Rhipicephalus microplus]